MKAAGYVWLAASAGILIYLLWPALVQPSRLKGPAGPEYWVPQLVFALVFSIPGLLLVLLESRRKSSGT